MKTRIIGILAIVIAVGLSAFTSPAKTLHHKKGSGLYWFKISGSRTPSQNVPQADATFMQQSDTAPDGSCPDGSAHQCVSGFSSTKVNTITNQLNGTQTPDDVDQTQL